MTKPLLLSVLAFCLAFSTGCIFSKKSRVKDNGAIAADVEASFRKRWIEKRTSELTAQGQAVATAQSTAETEFRERYGFIQAAKK